jgi:hypothetical protein
MSSNYYARLHAEIGCWADGTHGHQYTRDACAATLEYYATENFVSRGLAVPEWRSCPIDRLVASLRGEMSDDASEEDDATDWLNEHAPFTGAFWGWRDGDFGLWTEEEEP